MSYRKKSGLHSVKKAILLSKTSLLSGKKLLNPKKKMLLYVSYFKELSFL